MASDQGPIIQGTLLRNELIRLRKERGLTQQQVAEALEWSASKLIRVEGGGSSITKVDLDALLGEYELTSEDDRARLHALNRGARERAWWDRYKDEVPALYLRYVGLEAGAAFIRQFQIGFIPGLLQTAAYAEVVTAIASSRPDQVKLASELRLRRQAELRERSAPPHQYFVLDEAVIRRHIGIKTNRAIMPDQLRSVADRAELDELVTVRVIPFDAGAHPGLIDPFILLEFEAGLPDALYLDTELVSGDDPRVAERSVDFEKLVEVALSPVESVKLIRSAAEEMS